jgi:hypothetical protein
MGIVVGVLACPVDRDSKASAERSSLVCSSGCVSRAKRGSSEIGSLELALNGADTSQSRSRETCTSEIASVRLELPEISAGEIRASKRRVRGENEPHT